MKFQIVILSLALLGSASSQGIGGSLGLGSNGARINLGLNGGLGGRGQGGDLAGQLGQGLQGLEGKIGQNLQGLEGRIGQGLSGLLGGLNSNQGNSNNQPRNQMSSAYGQLANSLQQQRPQQCPFTNTKNKMVNALHVMRQEAQQLPNTLQNLGVQMTPQVQQLCQALQHDVESADQASDTNFLTSLQQIPNILRSATHLAASIGVNDVTQLFPQTCAHKADVFNTFSNEARTNMHQIPDFLRDSIGGIVHNARDFFGNLFGHSQSSGGNGLALRGQNGGGLNLGGLGNSLSGLLGGGGAGGRAGLGGSAGLGGGAGGRAGAGAGGSAGASFNLGGLGGSISL